MGGGGAQAWTPVETVVRRPSIADPYHGPGVPDPHARTARQRRRPAPGPGVGRGAAAVFARAPAALDPGGRGAHRRAGRCARATACRAASSLSCEAEFAAEAPAWRRGAAAGYRLRGRGAAGAQQAGRAWWCTRAPAIARTRCRMRCWRTIRRWRACRAPGWCIGSTRTPAALLVVARTPEAHTRLVAALAAREVGREYLALCAGTPTGGGRIDQPIGRHRSRAHAHGGAQLTAARR